VLWWLLPRVAFVTLVDTGRVPAPAIRSLQQLLLSLPTDRVISSAEQFLASCPWRRVID
jgi:hypothetical protein